MLTIYDRPPTPGQVIQVLVIEAYQLTAVSLAKRLGCQLLEVCEVLSGDRAVDAEFALRLAQLTGTSPQYWLDLQRDVDLYDARKTRRIDKALDKIEPFPQILRLRKLIIPTADEV